MKHHKNWPGHQNKHTKGSSDVSRLAVQLQTRRTISIGKGTAPQSSRERTPQPNGGTSQSGASVLKPLMRIQPALKPTHSTYGEIRRFNHEVHVNTYCICQFKMENNTKHGRANITLDSSLKYAEICVTIGESVGGRPLVRDVAPDAVIHTGRGHTTQELSPYHCSMQARPLRVNTRMLCLYDTGYKESLVFLLVLPPHQRQKR